MNTSPRSLSRLLIAGLLVAAATARPLDAQDNPAPPTPSTTPDAPSLPATSDASPPAYSPSLRIGRRDQDLVRVGSSVVLNPGERVPNLVVVFGDATVDGDVDRDLVVVGGNAHLNGKVGGDLVVVLGSAKLGPNARVQGDSTVVLGPCDQAPGAVIHGEQFDLNPGDILGKLRPLLQWARHGLLLGRPLAPGVGWAWWVWALHLMVYLGLVLVLPRPTAACAQTLETNALAAFFVGLLGFILLVPLSLVLAISGVGLLVLPFLACAVVAAVLIGKGATFQYLGLQVVRRLNPEASAASLAAFGVGAALITVVYLIPFLGFLAWGVLLLLALGAALLATFKAFQKNGKPAGAVPAPVLVPTGTPGMAGANPASGFTPPPPPDPATPVEVLPPGSSLPPGAAAPSAFPPGPPPPDYVAMPRVGFWRRCIATVLDFILLGWLLIGTHGVFLLLWLAYHVGMWTWKGTTIGGIVFGLKVVRLDGRPVDFAVALVRGLASVFSAVALGLGFFWAGWTSDRQSWHDKIAGTVIVRVPKGISLV